MNADLGQTRVAVGAGRSGQWIEIGLDLVERLIVVLLFAWLAGSVALAVGRGANWFNGVQVVTEGLNVFFILIRKRATAVSHRASDWLISIGAASGSLLARPAGLPPLGPPSLAGALILAGLVCQVWAKLTLRRSFGLTPANRGLKVRGPYRYVRHPMYLGYLVGWIGFYMLNPSLWNTLVYGFCLVCQAWRIEAEERVLAEDPAHAAYRAETRYRLIPGIW